MIKPRRRRRRREPYWTPFGCSKVSRGESRGGGYGSSLLQEEGDGANLIVNPLAVPRSTIANQDTIDIVEEYYQTKEEVRASVVHDRREQSPFNFNESLCLMFYVIIVLQLIV